MSSGTSSYASTLWLPVLFGLATIPVNMFAGLVTQQPRANDDGGTVSAYEPDDAAYRRVTVGIGSSWWDAINGTVANHSQLNFATPTADWGTITQVILCDQVSLGNLLAWGDLRNPQPVLAGVAPNFPAGSLVMSMPAG